MFAMFRLFFFFLAAIFFYGPLHAQIIETVEIKSGTRQFRWAFEKQAVDFRYLSFQTAQLSGQVTLTQFFDDGTQLHQELTPFHDGPLPDRVVFDVGAISGKVFQIALTFSVAPTHPVFLRSYGVPLDALPANNFVVTTPEVSCACSQPSYCDRACWCPTNDCDPVAPAASTAPTHIIVHHSAGSNTSSNFAAVVAAIQDFHVNTNGWDDIGYNWLIDPNGVIYEGRGDGKRGAHFSCMNGGTTGICLLGNYQTTTPTAAAITALEDLLAWEACDKNIAPGNWSWHSASQQHMASISGHRDGNAAPAPASCAVGTVCPGNSFYPQLPDLRMRVAAKTCFYGGASEQVVVSAASTLEAQYLAGTPLTFEAQQTYLGDSVQPRVAQLRVYLSQQTQLSANAQLLGLFDDTLSSNQNSGLTRTQWPLPAGLSAGTWYLHFLPDGLERFQVLDSNRTVTVSFEILGTIGSPSAQGPAPLRVYPHPAIDWVELECPEQMRLIEIFDLQGRLLQSIPATGISHRLDLSALPRGTYLLTVRPELGRQIYSTVLVVGE
jgi:hypothetical protein